MPETTRPLLTVDEDGRLMCPLCRTSVYVHLDDVVFATGYGDPSTTRVHVRLSDNAVTENALDTPLPVQLGAKGTIVVIGGWCENCSGRFALELGQHKGHTLTALRTQTWVDADHS